MGDYGDTMMRDQNAAVQGRTKAQNRANVLQLKLIGQSHPTGLTNSLLKLFEPRSPLVYKPPPEKRKCPPYSGVAQLVSEFANPDDPEYATPIQKGETPAQRRARIHAIRLEEGAKKAAEEFEKYDPNNDPNISGDPYKTLFVARLNYETSESRIKREFEAYGPIKRIRLITDKETSKPRGYAFIEFAHTRDMKAAYKQADGKKIDNRRVLVDVERGRTVPNWRPRRLGGGLGTTRVGSEEVSQKYPGREQVQSGGISVSEEPRVRDERDRDREKSRDRGREKERERERSRELSNDRPNDRDHRDDRHHRNRDRNRDRERERDRERDHGRDRERDRTRDRGREREKERDRDRERGHDRHRDREKERDRDMDNEVGDDYNRGRPHDHDYERVDSKHERDRGARDRDYGSAEAEDNRGWPDQPEHGHGYLETEHDRGHYYEHHGQGQYDDQDGQHDYDRYREADRDDDRYDQMDDDGYGYGRATSDAKGRDNRRSD
ncbi:U1 small nuclear ribonucleoprotein 70 kDa-like [Primulina huaijiensis]|uniref:U1 small nuclear ribonucleoprotein 70 kDa-like n=1 Tax=Primulina huaijiensis TaxID=1492673 RepID=UPI003CC77993